MRNPTSFALAMNWLVQEYSWMVTGHNVTPQVAFCADVAVVAIIFMKATWREGCRTYPTMREQAQCFWRALTMWDKLVAAGYVFATWPIYVLNIDPYHEYWALFYICIAQYLFAGSEALTSMLGSRKGRVMPDRPPGDLAYAGSGDGT
jgi:hypothetical protein